MKNNKNNHHQHQTGSQLNSEATQAPQQNTTTPEPVVSRAVAKELEREDFLKKIRKSRTLKALLRDSQKSELQDYLAIFTEVVNDRITELQAVEDQQVAERKAAEDTIKELREKGINLDLIKDLLSK
ncbi:hypothetical protein [Photobacterium aquimaris]|uniref:DNA-binding protein H-NS-like N-terminal domain-containing protein n=1 Tax=Photobacterium aquimaris TaxID=512643 RepID=A0A2T3HWS5_9GAMM|nr:hypothetical protein [Photobacterium aquimaris]OBU21839.1 hypothetical protein AYY21_16005 [Photobacterium aquimaris]PQJ37160.1 hypothetical protein BTN98_18640 [Photobacterium aquimaris]PSU03466.1 hypothetical protein C0W81_11910 [Photobacterium aquimaris]